MTKKIKILHVLPNLSGGGAERICVNILTNLNQEKFSCALLLFKDSKIGETFKAKLAQANIPIIPLKKRCLIDPFNFYQINKAIKKINPDIIHTHLGGDVYGLIAGKINKVKVIVSTEHNLNKSEKKIITALKKKNAKYFSKIFAVSDAVREDAISRYKLNPNHITVLHNGIDLNIFTSDKSQKLALKHDNENKIIIGALGRLTAQKGFMSLIEAAAKTRNKNYLIEIGGVGELAGELQKRIKDLELINRVQLIGQVEAKDFLQKIDIFVLPSIWEGLGLAILEAGAMEKPIISSRVDGIKEILNDNNAFLFPAGDDDELAKTIDEVIINLNSAETREKTIAVKNIIEAKFSLPGMIAKYESWYDELLRREVN